jgi:hypothetical protein
MDPNCRSSSYTCTEIVGSFDIKVLEKDYSSEWAFLFPTFLIPKKK